MIEIKSEEIRYGYVYDTIADEGYFIGPPPELFVWNPTYQTVGKVLGTFEDRHMLVSTPKIDGSFFLHDPYENCWKKPNYQPLPKGICGPSWFLDGILYICDTSMERETGYELYACLQL